MSKTFFFQKILFKTSKQFFSYILRYNRKEVILLQIKHDNDIFGTVAKEKVV